MKRERERKKHKVYWQKREKERKKEYKGQRGRKGERVRYVNGEEQREIVSKRTNKREKEQGEWGWNKGGGGIERQEKEAEGG